MALFRLVYVSTSLLSADPDEERRQVADILQVSRRNNEEAEITGALLFSNKQFSQVLEGERDPVERLYERLNQDPRHKDLILLLTEPLATRQFPEWSMAYVGPSQSADEATARVGGGIGPSPAGDRARVLLSFMGRMLARGAVGPS